MKRNFSIFAIVLLFLASCGNKLSETADKERLTDYVNPFIGTGYHGHTYPGAAYPFGQIQLSPDNGTQGWDWCSGYHYSDSTLAGFSHLHLSGTGIGDLADISFLPLSSEVEFIDGEKNQNFVARYADKYKHINESASPGYYSVLLNSGIKAELTVTERLGFHRYTFPGKGPNTIIINLGFAINWDKPYETTIDVVDENLVTGSRLSNGWAQDQHVYFAVRFSEPFRKSDIREVGGKGRSVGVFTFTDKVVSAKVGVSSVSVENALANLDSSKPGDWNFDDIRKDASDAWEKELSKIVIKSDQKDQKVIFYTSLYHTMVAPALFSDSNSEFKGVKGNVLKAEGYKRYTVFSLWDTYRALHPLFTLIQQPRVNDMVKSMLDHYDQTGILPVWELEGNETFCMVANHSISVIGEAILKNAGDFDYQKAYEAMKATSFNDRDGMGLYDKLGYMPADKIQQSVAKSEEVAIDDWSVAAVAEKLGKKEDADYFRKRSISYRNYFDKESGFMRGKLSNGKWTTPFDPAFSNHEGSDYTEGNAWQYLWLAPQDVDGLIGLLGGKEAFADKLEQLFKVEEGVKGEKASADISGLIGAYAHGNEPGHHTTFLFNYAGRAWRTQELNRKIQTEMYSNTPEGLCGNEDCGQMSAWYIFSALGFYPVNPSELKYQFGSPIVQEAKIEIGPEKYFTVLAPLASKENLYIQKVLLNGKELDRSYITHQEIMDGGVLEFIMGSTPVKALFAN